MATVAETFALAFRHHQTGNLAQAERMYREVLQFDPGHADTHHLLGVLAFQSGRFDVAVASFRNATSLKPGAADFQSNLGLALANSGRLHEAITCFQSALQLNPILADTHSNLANALLRIRKPDDARTHYEQALKLRPDNAEAHCGLGVLLGEDGKFSEAEARYREALRINPSYVEAHTNLAHALQIQGRPLDSMAHSKQALLLRPQYPEAHVSLGNALLSQQKWREAESSFREALRFSPDFVEAHNGLGHALERQNRLAEARSCCEHALRLRPDHADAINGLGNIFVREQDYDSASQCYRRALRLKPNFPSACNNLGCLLAQQDKLSKAVSVFQLALRLQPNHAEALCNLGDALRRQGKLAAAAEACRRALRIKPDYAAAHFNLGLTHEALSNVNEAAACFEQALRLEPDSAETHANLAHVQMEQGKFNDAVAHYERAVFLKPDYGEAHVNLAVVLAEQGNMAKSEMHFKHALRWWPTAKVRIKAATLLPPLYQSSAEMLAWRQRVTDQVQLLHDEGVKLDVSKDSARTVFYLAYQGLNDRDLQRHIARLYVAPHEFSQRPRRIQHGESGKIKVGMISHCFRHHSVGHWMRGLVAELSRQDFNVTVLSAGRFDDDIARFFKQHADQYDEVPRSLPDARRLIADHQFDVLIYTDIGMDPHTYSLALSRLAPVQCATVGHPVTSGLDTVDYYISSEDLETPGSEEHYCETLIRLRNLPIHMYRPASPPRTKRREDFSLSAQDHVYHCLQSLFKFHPQFDEVLGGILRGDPRGILLLSRGRVAGWEQLLRQRFAVTLPDVSNRIRFLPLLDYPSYMDLLELSDVQLDPIHFGGGCTSYEAFSVGLPIVTQPSRFLRGRFTWALYKQMNILDCAAKDAQEYIKIANRLGTDKAFRDETRTRILGANHVLFQNSMGVRDLEKFLKQAVNSTGSN